MSQQQARSPQTALYPPRAIKEKTTGGRRTNRIGKRETVSAGKTRLLAVSKIPKRDGGKYG